MNLHTPCNYCALRALERIAGGKDYVVTVIDKRVYSHPREMPITWDSPAALKDRYFVMWMQELTDHCVC